MRIQARRATQTRNLPNTHRLAFPLSMKWRGVARSAVRLREAPRTLAGARTR